VHTYTGAFHQNIDRYKLHDVSGERYHLPVSRQCTHCDMLVKEQHFHSTVWHDNPRTSCFVEGVRLDTANQKSAIIFLSISSPYAVQFSKSFYHHAQAQQSICNKFTVMNAITKNLTNCSRTHNTHTHNHFAALLKYVRDHPGEQVPER